jgi:cell fate (sporulation/competence/biofilm development) regulator YlbF (YheA/YmcA/DUF963 family)
MPDGPVNELEIAPPSVVRQAACDFAAALAGTAQFKAYERATTQLQADPAARAAMEAYQQRQQALQAVLILNALSQAEQDELESLRAAFLSAPAVVAYQHAEADLQAMCQAVGDTLSQAIGLDFGAACRTGCC